MKWQYTAASILLAFLALGCAPKVGSDAWCEKQKEIAKADWSTNDAVSFAKHCVFE